MVNVSKLSSLTRSQWRRPLTTGASTCTPPGVAAGSGLNEPASHCGGASARSHRHVLPHDRHFSPNWSCGNGPHAIFLPLLSHPSLSKDGRNHVASRLHPDRFGFDLRRRRLLLRSTLRAGTRLL